MEKHFSKERTLIIVKPDGVQRTLVGEIISRYERLGLKLVAMKMVVPTPEHIEQHYTLDPEWRRVTGEKTIAGYKAKGMKPPTENPLEVTDKLLINLKSIFLVVQLLPWFGRVRIQSVWEEKSREERSL